MFTGDSYAQRCLTLNSLSSLIVAHLGVVNTARSQMLTKLNDILTLRNIMTHYMINTENELTRRKITKQYEDFVKPEVLGCQRPQVT